MSRVLSEREMQMLLALLGTGIDGEIKPPFTLRLAATLAAYRAVVVAAGQYQRAMDALDNSEAPWPSDEAEKIQDDIRAAEVELFARLAAFPEDEEQIHA